MPKQTKHPTSTRTYPLIQMVKGLIRFALIWAISMFLTPYLNRFLDRLATRVPKNSFLEELLLELSSRYSATLIRAFGETLSELAFGSKR